MNRQCIAAGCFLALQYSKSAKAKTRAPEQSLLEVPWRADAFRPHAFGRGTHPAAVEKFSGNV